MSRLFVLLVNVVGAMMFSSVSLEDANRTFEQSDETSASKPLDLALSRDPRFLFKNFHSPSSFFLHLHKRKVQYQKLDRISSTTAAPSRTCICVPFYLCDANQTIITDGSGIIDFRAGQCTGEFEVCCYLRNSTTPRPTNPPTVPPITPTRPPTLPPTLPPIVLPTMTARPPATAPPVLNCICVDRSLCDPNGIVTFYGEGIINPRQQAILCPGVNQVCCSILIIPTQPPTRPPATMTPSPPITVPPITVPPITVPPVTVPPVTIPPGQTRICFVCNNTIQCISCGIIIMPDGGGTIDPRFSQILTEGNICSARDLLPCQASTVAPVEMLGPLKNPNTPQACYCVKSWLCSEGNVVPPDGLGVIDPRFTACPSVDQVCCRLAGIDFQVLGNVDTFLPRDGTVSGARSDRSSAEITCGARNDNYAPTQPLPTGSGKTYFAEFPWMVALVARPADGGARAFLCGASMISNSAVLTAAHCVINRKPKDLVARFGQWNVQSNTQPLPIQEANVLAVITHPSYYSGGLFHDVAVLILERPVVHGENVLPICLPEQGTVFAAGTRCHGIGWGSSSFGQLGSEGNYQAEMRKVELPIVDRASCQTRLRRTKLGQHFQLHGSFICAGGEANRDMCRGDGGGPLVCQASVGQFFQAGIVSWGIGCGTSDVPAVYTSVSQHRQWVDQQLATYGV